MDPVAFHLGPLTIRWYGICVAVGFLVGFQWVQFRAPRFGIDRDTAANLVLLAMGGGILGGRVLYVVHNWGYFSRRLAEIPRVDHGGLVFYGGFLGTSAALYTAVRLKRYSTGDVADLFVSALPLSHAIGRVGCFLNGCCFGHPARGSFAVSYPPGSEVMAVQKTLGLLPRGASECLPVFPVQLLSVLVNVSVFLVLLFVQKHRRRRGELIAAYLALFPLGRFLVELGRGDYVDRVGPLTPAQLICIVLFPLGVGLFLFLRYGSGPDGGTRGSAIAPRETRGPSLPHTGSPNAL